MPGKIVRLDITDSTNDYAKKLITSGKFEHKGIVITNEQTRGRGQGENQWHSEGKKNLLLSVMLDTSFLDADKQFYLSKSAALATCDFISLYCENTSIKWPNDIYVNDEKIAGILIEHTVAGNKLMHSIAGFGININQTEFDPKIPNPTSLKLINEIKIELSDAFDIFTQLLFERFAELEQGNFNKIETDYLPKIYKLGESTTFKKANELFEATIIDVDPDGRLVLVTNGQKQKYAHHEIVQIIA